jgi:hypothetical protein
MPDKTGDLSSPPTNGVAYWVSSKPEDCQHDQCVVIRQRVTIKGQTNTVAVHMHLDHDAPVPLTPYDLVRHAMSAISSEIHARERLLSLDDPCGCADEYGFDEHTNREHEKASCGGVGSREPCGGCYDCMIAQQEYHKRKREENDAEDVPAT